MTRTVADASRDYRKRQREKLERYEAALREIEDSEPEWAASIATQALKDK